MFSLKKTFIETIKVYIIPKTIFYFIASNNYNSWKNLNHLK